MPEQSNPADYQPPAETSLPGSLTALLGESRALRQDVHAAERARRKASFFNLGLLGLLAACVVLLVAMSFQTIELTRETKTANATMADCTTPGGKCYAQSNARTGKAISDLIRSQVFVSECGRQWPGEAGPAYDLKLENCVARRLAGQADTPDGPTPAPSPSVSPSGR